MYSNLNPRTMGMNHHPYEKLRDAAVKHGFQGIEVPAHAFGSVKAAQEEGKRLESLGLRWGLMMTPCDMFKVPDDEFETGLEQWARWLERARAAGCTRAYNHFWPGSDERSFDENFEWHRKRLAKIWHVMEETGMQYGLEFMGAQTVCDQFKHPFIRSLCGTIALADSVSEKISIVFDGIHWYTSGARNDDLYWALGHIDRVVNLHLNDASPFKTALEQWDRERALPNTTGAIDSTRIVKMFHERGYEGPVMLEPMSPATDRWESMDLDSAAAEAAECLNGILKQAGAWMD